MLLCYYVIMLLCYYVIMLLCYYAIFQNLESFGKGRFSELAVEKFWLFVLEHSEISQNG